MSTEGALSNLRRRIGQVAQSQTARDSALVVGGTAAGQALMLLALPVVTRLYSPEAFGISAVFLSLLVPLHSVASLRYEMAIPIAGDDDAAAGLLVLSLGLVAVLTLMLGVATVTVGDDLVGVAGLEAVAPYLMALPLAFMGAGVYSVLTFQMVRMGNYRVIGTTQISQGAAQSISQVGLGLIGAGAGGLIAGIVIRMWAGVSTIARASLRTIPRHRLVAGVRDLRATLREWRRIPLLAGNATFLGIVAQFLPPLMFAILFGPVTAGLVSLTLRLLEAPITLVSKSAAKVYYGTISAQVRTAPGEVRAHYSRTVRVQALLALPVVAIVLIPAPWIFPAAFGSEWAEAAGFMQVLGGMFFAQYLATTVGPETLVAAGREDLYLRVEGLRIFLVVAAFLVAAALSFSALWTAAAFGVASTIGHGAMLSTGWRVAVSLGSRTVPQSE